MWAVTFKQAEGDLYVAYDELVEEVLCFGWIDSLRKSMDVRRSRQLMTPRKPGSGWSRVNKERIVRLEGAGLMTEAGRRLIDAAKADGSWTMLDAIENLEEPAELRAALDATPEARRNWDGFPSSAKRALLLWVGNAKREETRERRIEVTVTGASENVRANGV